MGMKRPLFPSWFDKLVPLGGLLVVGGVLYAVVLILLSTSPNTTATGYMPTQPVPYSHALHAGELGIDCRYCHTGVEIGAKASIPPTQTCMNCHANVRKDSKLLEPVRESFATGMPIEWVRVHDLPDFVYFDHSAHVTRGVSCVSCHGRVDQMDVVYQAEPLNMGWCLSCHRNPESHLRPRQFVTDLGWQPDEDPAVLGARLREELGINPSTDCSVCHR